MSTQDDPKPDDETIIPPGKKSEWDKYLLNRIEKSDSVMNELTRAVDALPVKVDERIAPLNGQLATIAQTIESLSRLSDNVEKIRAEFTGFQEFRTRVEGYEVSIKDIIKKNAFKMICAVVGAALALISTAIGGTWYLASSLTAINANVNEVKSSVNEVKSSSEKLQAAAYELNGATKGHAERLKSLDEQLKTVQTSVQNAATRTVNESSDKTSERIAGMLKALEKSIEKNNADFAERFGVVEQKIRDVSPEISIIPLITLPRGASALSETQTTTTLTYEIEVTAAEIRTNVLVGTASFVDGKPDGLVSSVARPPSKGKIRIDLTFRSEMARAQFLTELKDKAVRLKITYLLK